jgi:endonuclease III
MYAALLENATFDKAGLAYAVLENYYIDWNEIRVCSVRELADTLTDLPNPEAAADRVRKTLQGIFEKTYMFDLEDMRKKGKALAEHIKTLESMSAGTPYMIQYVAQVALDGHLIPFDEASLRIMRRLGLSQVSSDGTKETCIGLDRVILKKSSLTFAAQLHHYAASYFDVPDSPELLSQLSAIDSEAVNRSWMSPVVVTSAQPAAASVPTPAVSIVSETKPEPPRPPQTPKAPAKAKPVVKPAKKPPVKSVPIKKSPAKSAATKPAVARPVKKPVKSVKPVVAKKMPSKVSAKVSKKPLTKKPLGKKTPPKKPVRPSVKPVTPKKKAAPVKKKKTVSPSKALRKKKPK